LKAQLPNGTENRRFGE